MKTTDTLSFLSNNGIKSATEKLPNYRMAEKQFENLLGTEALDQNIKVLHPIILDFEGVLEQALIGVYKDSSGSDYGHRFLQRILYRINRMKLFWYDDLKHYKNERSTYLLSVRNKIEEPWQAWELKIFENSALKEIDVEGTLRELTRVDLESEPSETAVFFRDHVGVAGYRRLLEITSLDGLVEASQLSRMLGGVGNEIHSMLTRLFLEEYGGGRLSRKHSTFFEAMLDEFGLKTEPEAYFNVVPWEVLAGINHSFLLSERKLFYLRYIGGLLYTEVSVPSSFCHYASAARRLNFPQSALGYWDLHVKEDERHGHWMLENVALPLARLYPDDGWQMIFGYKQQQLFSQRSGEAIARSAKKADSGGIEENYNEKEII